MKPRRNSAKKPLSPPPPQAPVKSSTKSLQIIGVAIFAAALIAIGAWFYWHRHSTQAGLTQAKSDYVDPVVCASCHEDVAATYSKTGMGRSFYRPTSQNTVEDYNRNNTLDHAASGYSYAMVQRDGKFFQRRHTTGFDGSETNVVETQVDYVIGSGNHARTYLHRTPTGELNELPVSWYVENSGSWGMSPGYDRKGQEDIHRPIPAECLFCHNGYAQFDQGAAGVVSSATVFPAKLPEGIDCQRCHGPGRAHVEAARAKTPRPELVRASIVNPGNLPRERQLEVCMQCHLETSSRHMPNEIRAYGRDVLSYRPGEPLADYKLYFDRVTDAKDDTFEVAHAAYRLRKSKCFLKSEMTCTTCHNPHDIPRGEEATQMYVGICQKCHQAVIHRAALPAGSNCIGCHMPKRRTEDVVHVVMTDHFIRSYKSVTNFLAPIEEKAEVESGSEVVPYYPADISKLPDGELYLAVAQVNDGKEGRNLPRLAALLKKLDPKAPEPYVALGKAYAKRGQPAEAIPWFDAALTHAPNDRTALGELVPALTATNQNERALQVVNRAVALYPKDDLLLTTLGNVSLRLNHPTEAQNALARAIAINPERADAHNLLGLLALQANDKVAAERSFREALRWQPDLVEAQNNLATLLTGNHQFPEAQFLFAKALASDPASAEAHHGFGMLLTLKGAIPEAEAEMRAASRLKPDSAQNHGDLADVLMAQGAVSEAAEEYRQVLRIKPDQADAQLGLGLALVNEHKNAEARIYLESAARSNVPDISQAAINALRQVGP